MVSNLSSTTVNSVDHLGHISEELDEGVNGPSQAFVESHLRNSEYLLELPLHLSHFSDLEKADSTGLINFFPSLFPYVSTHTSVLEHDIDVGRARPIKQHAYCINPRKRVLLRKEVVYLLNNGLADPT